LVAGARAGRDWTGSDDDRDETATSTTDPAGSPPMTRTVGELRNDIRTAVGRFERPESTGFTKESLAAICEAVGYDIDTDRLPSKAQMRAGILAEIGELETDDPDDAARPLRKTQLQAIAAALDAS